MNKCENCVWFEQHLEHGQCEKRFWQSWEWQLSEGKRVIEQMAIARMPLTLEIYPHKNFCCNQFAADKR